MQKQNLFLLLVFLFIFYKPVISYLILYQFCFILDLHGFTLLAPKHLYTSSKTNKILLFFLKKKYYFKVNKKLNILKELRRFYVLPFPTQKIIFGLTIRIKCKDVIF